MKYKYEGRNSILVYDQGKAVSINSGDVVELTKKPNSRFVEIIENKNKEIKKKKKQHTEVKDYDISN